MFQGQVFFPFKIKMNTAPKLIDELLKKSLPVYNLRWTYEFDLKNKIKFHYDIESMSFLGPKIWDLVLEKI